MKTANNMAVCINILITILTQVSTFDLRGTQFASHVSVNTPARSYSHGVGDPIPVLERRAYQRQSQQSSLKNSRRPASRVQGRGYPRENPAISFQIEETTRKNPTTFAPWQHRSMDYSVPVLPLSPYKVDSPDPESLWPLGLFLPPINPHNFGPKRRVSSGQGEEDYFDPYLLEGALAKAAVIKAYLHGLYFHDVPHIKSLLANQELRIENNLKPHRLGSIRPTWPFNRP